MLYQIAAELVLTLHLVFIGFVIGGGVAVRWWPRIAWLHAPMFVWGSVVNLAGWVCPLTPLENELRRLAGESGYPGSFIEQYIAPVVYPAGMTSDLALATGVFLLVWNLAVYAWAFLHRWSAPADP